jgi:hypothetical protein
MKVHIVTPYRDSHFQHYGVTVRGNAISVYPPYGVMFCLCVTNHHATVDGGEWSASRSGRCGRRGEFFRPSRESNLTSSVVQPVAQ